MNFPAITITDSTPLVLNMNQLMYNQTVPIPAILELSVDTGDTVYMGDTPPPAFDLTLQAAAAGQKYLTFINEHQTGLMAGRHAVMAGMVVTSTTAGRFTAGSVVLGVTDEWCLLNLNVLGALSGDPVTFTAPAISSTNGIPLVAGSISSYDTTERNKFLNGSLTFVVGTGKTGILRIRYRY